MLKLIPAVKELNILGGAFTHKGVRYDDTGLDSRLQKALKKLPYDEKGAKLTVTVEEGEGEDYRLEVQENAVSISAKTPAGAFYAIQTLRQILMHEEIPCLEINDAPDFGYRGFYHDVTRGRIPTVESMKWLIDRMAFYKLNSLQLYVEHVFPYEETKDIAARTGFITPEELLELQAYCQENFIEFIPSMSCFGHLFELLEQPQYRHLRVLKDYDASPNFWNDRMRHHTIDPSQEESYQLICSMIDQYMPLFQSEYFNICCDETFDLENATHLGDPADAYCGFVQKLIDHVKSKGKKVMIWADILAKHPEQASRLPDDTIFLAWEYIAPLRYDLRLTPVAESGKKMIVCPGCTNWNRLCEKIEVSEENISLMTQYGYEHGAMGVLNTSWGDWGHPCSLQMSMYGMILGAERSWRATTPVDDAYRSRVSFLEYEQEEATSYLQTLCKMHAPLSWLIFGINYYHKLDGTPLHERHITPEELDMVQKEYPILREKLEKATWKNDIYRQHMLCAAEGLCVVAELMAKMQGLEVQRLTDTEKWLDTYCRLWLQDNKPSELHNLVKMFRDIESMPQA